MRQPNWNFDPHTGAPLTPAAYKRNRRLYMSRGPVAWARARMSAYADDRRLFARSLLMIMATAAVTSSVLGGIPQMLLRRAQMSPMTQASVAQSMPHSADHYIASAHPISWRVSLARDQKGALLWDAMHSDLDYMSDGFDPAEPRTWSVLPVVATQEDLRSTMFGLMADDPSLTVYTNGEVCGNMDFLAAYSLPLDGESRTDNKEQQRMLVAEATRRAHVADAYAGDDDEAYVRYCYGMLASTCTYADGKDDTEHRNDPYGALVEGESMCYGMSGALKLLLDYRGIPNCVVRGHDANANTGWHAWNLVYLDGTWSVCDVTAYAGTKATGDDYDNKNSSYWNRCLCPVAEYMSQVNKVMTPECWELVRDYCDTYGITQTIDEKGCEHPGEAAAMAHAADKNGAAERKVVNFGPGTKTTSHGGK